MAGVFKKVWPVILMILISITIIGSGCYYYLVVMERDNVSYDNGSSSTSKNVNSGNKDQGGISIDSPYINELVSKYDYVVSSDLDIIGSFYNPDRVNMSDMNEEYKRAVVVTKLTGSLSNRNVSISVNDFNNQLKLLFGNDSVLENQSFSLANGCSIYNYRDSSDGGYYQYSTRSGNCGGASISYMDRKVIKVSKNKDTLDVVIAYAISSTDGNVYTDWDGTKVLNPLDGVLVNSLNVREIADRLHQSKYVYVYDKTNFYYYLDHIEKVK